VRSLAVATPPKAPVENVPYKKLVVVAAAFFLAPFGLGLLFEFRAKRLTGTSSIEKHGLLAPVVGEVARLPSGSNSSRSRRVFEESVDTLRANLFLAKDSSQSKTFAIVSSMSGEGKSSVASQLAISIAKATGETVLLVDADLRCPDQHDIFGLEMNGGLVSVLAGNSPLQEVVNQSLGNLIHVIVAGKLTKSPHRLLSPDKVRQFIEEASKHYQYIVFDTAPILSAGETLAITSVVDSTLVCVMRDVSRIDAVTRTTRRLEASGARIAGTVFSGLSTREYAYRYGDYHYTFTSNNHVEVS
jgi:capsular exopolysaccharide synthesis family protein